MHILTQYTYTLPQTHTQRICSTHSPEDVWLGSVLSTQEALGWALAQNVPEAPVGTLGLEEQR